MDVDNIRPGSDFTASIDEALRGSSAVLVVIGPQWAEVTNREGLPRLEDPDDYVRKEVIAALEQDVLVVPVLVSGAPMPSPSVLPAPLRPLSTREAFEIRDSRWDRDVSDLAAALGATRRTKFPRPFKWIAAALLVGTLTLAAVLTFDALRGEDPAPPTREERALESLRTAIPPGASGCALAVTSMPGLEPDGASCELESARSTLTLEVHRVSAAKEAKENLEPAGRDVPGTCVNAPAGAVAAEFGDSGVGPFLCSNEPEQSISWVDTQSGVFARLSRPGTDSGGWDTLSAAWLKLLPETPEVRLFSSLPRTLSGCGSVDRDGVDNTRTAIAEMTCAETPSTLSTLRVGLTENAADQRAYAKSWVVGSVPAESQTCEDYFPNVDPWRANRGEQVRGTRWCFVKKDDTGKDQVRYVWTDEDYRVTYIVEDQGGGPVEQQRRRVGRFWSSLIENYPPAPRR